MADERTASPRRPVFFQIPLNWGEMTEDEKHARALQFVGAREVGTGEGT